MSPHHNFKLHTGLQLASKILQVHIPVQLWGGFPPSADQCEDRLLVTYMLFCIARVKKSNETIKEDIFVQFSVKMFFLNPQGYYKLQL